MKARIQVLSVEHRSGRSKTGSDYSLHICQCVVREVDADGVEKIQVGELVLPKGHPEVKAGDYDGEFGIAVGQDKRIGGRLIQLLPVVAARAAAPAASVASGAPRQ